MELRFTAVFRKVPGANTQDATLEEARANLQEAVETVMQANRVLIRETAGGDAIREPFKGSA